MNEKEIIDALKKGAEADAPLHSTHVRRALLSAHTQKGFAPLRRLITHIVMNRYSVPTTAFGIVALALVFNFVAFDASTVSAQEVANRAFARAIKISPEMRAQLEEKMKADMLETLKEARAAADLRILTREEFEKESPFTISTTTVSLSAAGNLPAAGIKTISIRAASVKPIAGEPVTITHGTLAAGEPLKVSSAGFAVSAGTTMEPGTPMPTPPQPVKYLSYTDSNGNKTVLGLDEHDTPVFKFAELKNMQIVPIEGDHLIEVPAEKALFFRTEAGAAAARE